MKPNYWDKSIPMGFVGEYKSYEEKRVFRYSLQDYMFETFQFGSFSGKKVLEIGCGAGIDAIEFARYGAIVTAIDSSEVAVALTRRLAEESGQTIMVVGALANTIPFKDNAFDCVYSFGVLHHLREVGSVLEEIQRVLKPDGTVMAMLYHKDSLLYAYSILYLNGNTERNPGCPYARVYTKNEATGLFSKYFTNVEVSVHYNVIDVLGKRKIKVVLPDKYELGWHLIVKAKKEKK